MDTINSLNELSEWLKAAPKGILVGIEGFTGSGKTTLANDLAKTMQICVYHLDDYADRFEKPPPYAKCLDIVGLQSKLKMRDVTLPSIVEGICLRDVLSLVGIAPALFVYVKRISITGLWHDGFHLEGFEAGNCKLEIKEIHLSDFKYHQSTRPHEQADLIYEWVGD